MKKNAFSLIELSIVLVILGLLTGSILAGQSLIRASEMRSVSVEFQRYATATYTFRDKYFALPGDFRDATKFWGFAGTTAAPGCLSTSGITAVTVGGTCDGNGAGSLNSGSAANATAELFQYWKQLALAGLIEGSYTGVAGPGAAQDTVIGTNAPASKLSNAGWYVGYLDPTFVGDGAAFAGSVNPYGNHFRFGSKVTNSATQGPVLKSEEAWNIDTKVDDGVPAKGKVVAYWWDDCTTATSNTDASATYLLSNSSPSCALFQMLGQ